ncbi:MAG: PstS family phosphate ABC transporter substrate-binding protein [Planctomycetaceae bacterium]|nr:PstS family phosphate ABC transporter substrate-binding protein [Planctomycetaceae bacterium]
MTILCITLGLTMMGCMGCNVETSKENAGGGADGDGLSGEIAIDGSSTVYPVSSAVAEEFQKLHPEVSVIVNSSGTGGGFKSFARGETAISDASRPVKPEEAEACKEAGIEFTELSVAIDGLTVMVNPENDWCDALTVGQLKSIWEKGSKVKKWKDLNPEWPDHEIDLYGPDTDSGTYDYFVEEICGEGGSRSDYTASADDNILVVGIAESKYALGYFGYAYYIENKDKLKAIGVSPTDKLEDAVVPTDETVESGEYTPLSRPLFIYVSHKALERPEVAAFVDFYLESGQQYVKEVGYVSLKESVVEEMKARVDAAKNGGEESTDEEHAEE